jgi:Nucleotidyl transferase of unknown function (DUF2204)
MPPAAGLADLLADLAAGLTSLGARWYIFGAQAALIWGRPRLTTDVDATVKLGGDNTETLVRALAGQGFATRIEATPEFIRQTRVLPLRHSRSGLDLDVVLAGPGLEDAFLERAIFVDVAGTAIPFISPEDLIVTKILAGRAKDLEDIRGVLEERGDRLQLDLIRGTLAMLEDALGQSDLRPAFESAFGHWQSGR